MLRHILQTSPACAITTEQSIDVYEKVIMYIGPTMDEVSLADAANADPGMYIHQFIVDDMSITRGEQFTTQLIEQAPYIQHADVILVDGELLGPLFDRLDTLQQLADVQLNTDLYVLASINQSAFRRMLATYRDVLNIDALFVVGKQYMGSLLSSLLLGKDPSMASFVKTYTVGLESSSKIKVISYLVDYLLYNNFPLGALLFVLLLPVLVVLISISRQIVGLSVFGVFYPIFFAFALHILGIEHTAIFFVAAFLTTLIVRRFTQRIYLLYSAKVSLLVVFYCVLTLLVVWCAHRYQLVEVDFSIFQNQFFLFGYLLILLVANRLFTEQFYTFAKGRWISLLEFAFVSLVMYRCISSLRLQNLVL